MAANKRKWAKEPLVLFVEGYSDLTFYAELLEHLAFPENFTFIQDIGGKTKLRDEAVLLLKPDNLDRMKAVAVLLDGDEDPDGAFRLAQRAILDAVGLEVAQPAKLFEEPRTKARFGIFIVGGSDGIGELESLAWEAWKSEDANATLKNCVDEFVDCAANSGLMLHSLDKVRIGAVLSVLNEDDPRLGAGARANLINFDAVQFGKISSFLLELKPFQ